MLGNVEFDRSVIGSCAYRQRSRKIKVEVHGDGKYLLYDPAGLVKLDRVAEGTAEDDHG